MAMRVKMVGVMVALAGSGLFLSACAAGVRNPIVGGGVVFDAATIETRTSSAADLAALATADASAVDLVVSRESGMLAAVDYTTAATKLSENVATLQQTAAAANSLDVGACGSH